MSACGTSTGTDITNESTTVTDGSFATDFPEVTDNPTNAETLETSVTTTTPSTEYPQHTTDSSDTSSTDLLTPDTVSSIPFNYYSVYLDSCIYFNTNDCIYYYDCVSGQTSIIWEQNDISGLGNIGNSLFFFSGYINEAGVPLSDKLCSFNLDTQECNTVLKLVADWYSLSTYSEYLWLYSGVPSPVTYTVDTNGALTEAKPPFTVDDTRHNFETPNYSVLTNEESTQLSITAPNAEPFVFEGEEHYFFILDASEDYLLFYEENFIEDTKSYIVYAYNSISNEVITLFDDLPSVIELHEQWVIAYLADTIVLYDLNTNTGMNLY